jgi:hypothetical protein
MDAYSARQGLIAEHHLRRVVEEFFKDCRELADWLWQDHQNTNLDKSAVITAVMGDPNLRLADAIAQTTKHHTRSGSDPITARISRVVIENDYMRARVGWRRPSGSYGKEDALELARKCVDAWRRFLMQHGLEP